MPLDQALQIAADIRVLRSRLVEFQNELSQINQRRGALQVEVTALQEQLVAKRAEFRAAATDA